MTTAVIVALIFAAVTALIALISAYVQTGIYSLFIGVFSVFEYTITGGHTPLTIALLFLIAVSLVVFHIRVLSKFL